MPTAPSTRPPAPELRRPRRLAALFAALAVVLAFGAPTIAQAQAGGGIVATPDVIEVTLEEGASTTREVTVTIPEGTAAARADVYLLADSTGSMGSPIDAVRDGAMDVVDGLVDELEDTDLAFGVGDFKDFQSPTQSDPYAFQHAQSMSTDTDAVRDAIDDWSASGGVDTPEGQFYAFDQILRDRAPSHDGSEAGTIGWRPGAQRLLVVFGDAPAHDPVCAEITSQVDGHEIEHDITEASVTAALLETRTTFIGVSTVTGPGMDADPGGAQNYTAACGAETSGTAGQATRLAEATGGVHESGIDSDALVDIIRSSVSDAITTIEALEVDPRGDAAAFVSDVSPDAHGPLAGGSPHEVTFTVDLEGIAEAEELTQVHTGELVVVADGADVATVELIVNVPGTSEVLLCPPGRGSGFPDVPASSVHADNVRCAAAFGIVLGRTADSYDPVGPLSRGQIASMLDRLANAMNAPIDGDRTTFSDVTPETSVHGDAIERLAGAGVINGDQRGRYRPHDPVTRGQLASLLTRFIETQTGQELPRGERFPDVEPGSGHDEALRKAREAGLVVGTDEGLAEASTPIRRDQAASLFVRAFPLLPVTR